MDHDPLELDADTMRKLGYQTIDWLVDRATRRRDEPVLRQLSPSEMASQVDGGAPAKGQELSAVLDQLASDVLPFRSRIDHPRYLAYVPGEGTWPGALGDLVASAYNIDAGNWMESAGPSHLEVLVLRWFAEWIGYPPSARGVLVSGGSAANLTALACAREALVGAMNEDVVAYVSDQGHSSLARAARILGFRPQQVRVLPVGRDFRMRVDALVAAIDADLEAGRRPLVVLAVAGTTNTGAVDQLPEIAAVCHRHGVWFHVDAAYGGFAAITPRGKAMLDGLELADSVTLDPHKWLYQPGVWFHVDAAYGGFAAITRSTVSSSRTRSLSIRTNGSTSPSSAERCSCVMAAFCAKPSRSTLTISRTQWSGTPRSTSPTTACSSPGRVAP
jgi:glutamate/tyrosine decarboxylase-like PLP-dependent enzyme